MQQRLRALEDVEWFLLVFSGILGLIWAPAGGAFFDAWWTASSAPPWARLLYTICCWPFVAAYAAMRVLPIDRGYLLPLALGCGLFSGLGFGIAGVLYLRRIA